MLHFFRKIRRELLANSQTIRYLKYGVGEIFLVVIGILIAIQVDNWNEERIAEEKTKMHFREVNNELVQNIANIDRILKTMILKDSLFFKVLKKGVTYEDYKANTGLFYFPFTYTKTSLSEDEFKVLLEGKNTLTRLQDSIFKELKDLYGKRKKNVDQDDETQHLTQINLRDKMMNEQEWFSSFHEYIITDEMIEYALTDPFYKNQLHEMRWRELWRTRGLLWFRTKALNLYEEIAHMLNIEKDTLLVMDVKDYEHIKGVYEYGNLKLRIWGENSLKADVFMNESLEQKWDIHPYSDSHFIGYMEEVGENLLNKIELGENGEVIGLSIFGDMVTIDGQRGIWKKIE